MIKQLLFLLAGVVYTFAAKAGGIEDFCFLYEKMPETYVRKISIKEIAEVLYSNLNVLDDKINVGGRKNNITLYYKGKSWNFSKPTNENVLEWCKLTSNIIDKASEFSEKFRNNDYLLSERVLQKSLPQFDKDSKFLGYDNDNKTLKNKRLFVARLESDGVLFIKIGVFNKNTVDELIKVSEKYNNINRIVMDLRGNPGGSWEIAIKAADLFLDEGIITSTINNQNFEEVFYNADEKEIYSGVDLLIMVDTNTASAAEMFAKALGTG